MKQSNEIYKCSHCGNMVEFIETSGVKIICCGDPMEHLVPQTADASGEKHVPFIEEVKDGYIVSVGKEVEHPMTEGHYIQFIELIVDGVVINKVRLTPNDKPKVHFTTPKGKDVQAKEYCNLHGLWSN